MIQLMVIVTGEPAVGNSGSPLAIGLLVPLSSTPVFVGEVCWQNVAPVEAQVYVYEPLGLTVIGPSEPLALTSMVRAVVVPPPPPLERFIITESDALPEELIQLIVIVTGELAVG